MLKYQTKRISVSYVELASTENPNFSELVSKQGGSWCWANLLAAKSQAARWQEWVQSLNFNFDSRKLLFPHEDRIT